ncbi:MAG TPA: glutathione S-transferase family protein [Gammaproteobacteria bacterium]|nr:glutathione S-transferase family protein [Gammaproteobacteria bacterium]
MKLYDFPLSGHAHRVRLMLSLLGINYELIHVKLDEAEHLGEAFSQINPFQMLPVINDNGFIVRDSVAIITYLSAKYAPQWYPQDAESIARVQEWLAIATKEIAEGPAAARLVNVFKAELEHDKLIKQSHTLLNIINAHLKDHKWLALDNASIADIAAYTYIAHAPEGDVSLESYPHILSWIQRVEALDGFVPMEKVPVGLAG